MERTQAPFREWTVHQVELPKTGPEGSTQLLWVVSSCGSDHAIADVSSDRTVDAPCAFALMGSACAGVEQQGRSAMSV
jgi:hypothetical protein